MLPVSCGCGHGFNFCFYWDPNQERLYCELSGSCGVTVGARVALARTLETDALMTTVFQSLVAQLLAVCFVFIWVFFSPPLSYGFCSMLILAFH